MRHPSRCKDKSCTIPKYRCSHCGKKAHVAPSRLRIRNYICSICANEVSVKAAKVPIDQRRGAWGKPNTPLEQLRKKIRLVKAGLGMDKIREAS